MTIGIGETGPNAGLAVFETLRLAERTATGSIGGYAVFAALGEDGSVYRAETQRGGTATLFTAGERTGVAPPPEISRARYAAVMSSGPDRPAPLSQFLPAEARIGLVTGHRLPNGAGLDGRILNVAVLDAMRNGQSAERALVEVLGNAADSDAGMIALGPDRGIAMLNSARVERRPDLGSALFAGSGGTAIAILHNAIWPAATLAPLLAEAGLEMMLRAREPAGRIEVRAGTPVVAATQDRVVVDDRMVAVRIETSDARIAAGRHNCAAIYVGSRVIRNGTTLGVTVEEPNVVVDSGSVVSLSGQPRFLVGYRTERKADEQNQGDSHVRPHHCGDT